MRGGKGWIPVECVLREESLKGANCCNSSSKKSTWKLSSRQEWQQQLWLSLQILPNACFSYRSLLFDYPSTPFLVRKCILHTFSVIPQVLRNVFGVINFSPIQDKTKRKIISHSLKLYFSCYPYVAVLELNNIPYLAGRCLIFHKIFFALEDKETLPALLSLRLPPSSLYLSSYLLNILHLSLCSYSPTLRTPLNNGGYVYERKVERKSCVFLFFRVESQLRKTQHSTSSLLEELLSSFFSFPCFFFCTDSNIRLTRFECGNSHECERTPSILFQNVKRKKGLPREE